MGLISNIKEDWKQRKETQAYIRQKNREADKLALDVMLEEKKKARMRLARKEIALRESRRERMMKKKYSVDGGVGITIGNAFSGIGNIGRTLDNMVAKPKKGSKRKNQDPLAGLID